MKADFSMAFRSKAKCKRETGEMKLMPYKQIADLPDSVKENLPKHLKKFFGLHLTAPKNNMMEKNVPFESLAVR
ncbi:hypothetical protein ANSO36C_40750 [Nostoc cf. commune SO-36]|uniref:Uncharacterized protein n=2 Tax=Nostoc commune TaxID=1178 RepID=A0ABN6Q9Z2_NOSCO|nr:hypothetical protein ANSO36C_40750 [Nostoc cf. commune SO-36]